MAKCLESDRFQVERDLNREYRRILTENNIDISYPQVVVNYPREKEYDVSRKSKMDADAFADEQREASRDIEEQQT